MRVTSIKYDDGGHDDAAGFSAIFFYPKHIKFGEIVKFGLPSLPVYLQFFNFSRKNNIFDNVVYMMEKYADNLEDLVSERTVQLLEEKKKTDALLDRILPR